MGLNESRCGSTRAYTIAFVLCAGLTSTSLTGQPVLDDSRSAELQPRIVNGVLTHDFPTVGLFDTGEGSCTGTMIGCQTFLTAAHCIPDQVQLQNMGVFLQHDGFFLVSSVTVHPSFVFGVRSDLAILKLDQPMSSISPSKINRTGRVPYGSAGIITGFGRAGDPFQSTGIKATGAVTTALCQVVNDGRHVCWNFSDPVGPAGDDSNTCQGDSGGPLFADPGSGTVVVGVTSGGVQFSCLPPDASFDADVYFDRAWIQSTAGSDINSQGCGPGLQLGQPGTSILTGTGTLGPSNQEDRFTFTVPADTETLRVSINAEDSLDVDLYVREGSPPTLGSFDCASLNGFPKQHLEYCEFPNPAPGTWHLLADAFSGTGLYQTTVTLISDPPDVPPPPPGAWLSTPDLGGGNYQAKVRITTSSGTIIGAKELACIPETLCVSGAIPGRSEVFIRVVGPKPNGYMWPTLVKFSTSQIEIWVQQVNTGQLNYYLLEGASPGSSELPGLFDREGFFP